MLLATALLMAGCGSDGSDTAAPPDREPEYTGSVIAVSDGRALVRAKGDACGIWVAPTEDLKMFRAGIDSTEPTDWSGFVKGQKVYLWIPGPIAESCPMQGAAEAVVFAVP